MKGHAHEFIEGHSKKVAVCQCGRWMHVNLAPEDVITAVDKRAVFIGRQEGIYDRATGEDIPGFDLFNVEWPGNELHGSTVGIETVLRLGIRVIVDKEGRKYVPAVPS